MSYYVPFQEAETEFTEKRSRFIGHVWRVEDEDAARRRIEQTRKKYHDARHNCWCYLLRAGGTVRYSDDGEPQGTAGQPMLNVFQRRGVVNVCCVVTRYFGGVLLGAGGLTRAYSRAAKDTLNAAGLSSVSRWTLWEIPCPYPLLEQVQREIQARGGRISGTDYGVSVTLRAAFPAGQEAPFAERLRQLSAASLSMTPAGEMDLPGEREDA
ncbi:MAG: YigZ family protein [Oscillibacter sp.]|nr:YigZ family protein [Oscillibacter sp.]